MDKKVINKLISNRSPLKLTIDSIFWLFIWDTFWFFLLCLFFLLFLALSTNNFSVKRLRFEFLYVLFSLIPISCLWTSMSAYLARLLSTMYTHRDFCSVYQSNRAVREDKHNNNNNKIRQKSTNKNEQKQTFRVDSK